MGAAPSKNEDDKVLVLCQERQQFVREALDGRCALVAAHFGYIQSLRHTGFALRKFLEPEVPTESFLCASTSSTPEPPIIRQKSILNLSPSFLQHVNISDSFSPLPSPLSSGHFHGNHMKAGGNSATAVEEKVPVPVTATVQSLSPAPRQAVSELDCSSLFEAPPGTPPWDYFGLFHPADNQLSFQDEKKLGQYFDNADDIRHFQKEGIPDLEEEGEKEEEKSPANEREDDFTESEDNFDNPSTESLVRMFKNLNDVSVGNTVTNQSPTNHSSENVASEIIASKNTHSGSNRPKNDNIISTNGTDDTHVMTPVNVAMSSSVVLPMNGKSEESFPGVTNGVKDLHTCMKEVEILFIKASDSGKEVLRMLEADKVQFRPLLPKERAHGSKASSFLTTFFACCREEIPLPQPPPQAEIKYLTWHRSVSSHTFSSRDIFGTASKEEVDGLTGNIFSGVYMNAGSHASTLDRLYAWERKLYAEVKVSSAICRRYDEKCKQLRHQQSRGESQINIDFTRATVKDLHSRILVAIQRIDLISKKIENLRDKELQPQLEELIGSLTRMWETMLECHLHQHAIIKQVSKSCNVNIVVQSESQCQAALLLQVELSTLCSNFKKWISSHKSYIHSLNSWLHKCMKPLKRRKSSRKRNIADVSLTEFAVAPIFTTCEHWIKLLDDLPTKDLEEAIKGLIADANHSNPHHQEKHHDSSKPTFSPHNGKRNSKIGEGRHKTDPPTHLQSSLEEFLEKLESFSDVSLQKYIDLQKNINAAREAFERGWK